MSIRRHFSYDENGNMTETHTVVKDRKVGHRKSIFIEEPLHTSTLLEEEKTWKYPKLSMKRES